MAAMKIEDVVLAATDTYSLPEICVKLRSAIDDPTVDVDSIARLISSDPILSAKLLRLANSALFRFSNQVETVGKALSVLGTEATYNLVMSDAACRMQNAFHSSLLNKDAFWYKCLLKGVLAKELARLNRVRGTERFFILGILCNLSELVVSAHFEKKYARYLDNKVLTLPWHAQHAEFNFTFPKASSAICQEWGLPFAIYMPLEKVFGFNAQSNDRDVATLQLAIKLVLYKDKKYGFEDIASLQPEVGMWQSTEAELIDLIDYCDKETKRLQGFY